MLKVFKENKGGMNNNQILEVDLTLFFNPDIFMWLAHVSRKIRGLRGNKEN